MLADAILVLHTLFTLIVVFSVPLIIAGGCLRWRWVHNPWFRYTHLAMIAFVAFESVIGMACPLTVWESRVRMAAGEGGYQGQDFIAHWLDRWLFYDFPHGVFTIAYIFFGLLVLGLLYVVPVRKAKKTPGSDAGR